MFLTSSKTLLGAWPARAGYRVRMAKSSFKREAVTNHFHRGFTVLALESSADDTCAAVVTSEKRIISNVVIKQHDQHHRYGGIHPMVAIHAHQKNMPVAVRKALDGANLDISQIDGIAFTRGPGISGCLSVCSNAAKTLASALHKPLVGVHHMQAHALTPLLTTPSPNSPTFPFLTLLVSGGHTLLLLASSPTHFTQLATTVDEAVGRTIDKVARDLGLPWGGNVGLGAALEAFCSSGPAEGINSKLPDVKTVPTVIPGRLAFSFSGLHSFVDRYISEHGVRNSGSDLTSSPPVLPDNHKLALARAFQNAAFAQLEEKVTLALRWCEQHTRGEDSRVKHIIVSGGVASNAHLRERLKAALETSFPKDSYTLVFPPPSLCTDNAAMIAWASMYRFLAGDFDDYSIEHRAKWSIEDLSGGPIL